MDGLLQYNKNTEDKRRPLITVSPQERQRRANADAIAIPIIKEISSRLDSITEEMLLLKKEGDSLSVIGSSNKYYTEEEFNDEVNNAIDKELSKLSTENVANEVKKLKRELAVKDEIIKELKTLEIRTSGDQSVETTTDVNRPGISTSVIDPSVDKELESHLVDIDTPDNTVSSSDIASKLGALKNILGG